MLKEITIERSVCDFCGEGSSYKCLVCGKDVCFECKKEHLIEFSHAVHFSGSGNGYYCLECHAKKLRERDPLLMAYRAILALQHEEKGFYEGFNERKELAEKHLQNLISE